MLKVLKTKSVYLVVVGQTYGIRGAGDCRRVRSRIAKAEARETSSEGGGLRVNREPMARNRENEVLPSSVDPLDPSRSGPSPLKLVSYL